MTKSNYNTTQLHPDTVFERHIFHRDQIAHVLRWFYVMKLMHKNTQSSVLDYGCGNANMFKLLYHNRCNPSHYLGLDIRKQTIDKLNEQYGHLPFFRALPVDLCQPLPTAISRDGWDFITCFEVAEHIGHRNIDQFLKNIQELCNENTTVLLSTPNYDEKVGPADNHLLGPEKEIGEWLHGELARKLEEYFTIEKKIGTFASQKDYIPLMNDWQTQMYNNYKDVFDSNMMSILMAPLFPEVARNCMWVLKRK